MRDLVERAQRGNHDAFDELVERHGRELYRLAIAVIGIDGAADVTQDALIRAWRELPTLRDPDAFLAWTRRILVNRCRDVVRARSGVRIISLESAMKPDTGGSQDGLPLVGDPAPELHQSADLRAAVERLRHDQREVIALHYAVGLPINEVARTLAIPDGTAKSRLNAALASLRRALAEPADG